MKKIILIYYTLLFIIITYPLFISTGNMYALDYIPHIMDGLRPHYGENLYLFYTLVFFTGKWIPLFLWERIIFILTFGSIMFGGYQLLKGTKNIYAILFGISLMIVNPFFYERIVDGQMNVYLASAGMIVYIALLRGFFQKPNVKKAIFIGIFSLLLTLTTIHTAYFIALACCVFFLVYSIGSPLRGKVIKYGILLGIITVGVNSFWAGPMVRGYVMHNGSDIVNDETKNKDGYVENPVVKRVQTFGLSNQTAFQTTPGKYGTYINVLIMKGYWGETYNRFLPSEGNNKKFIFIIVLIWGIILIGIYTCFIQEKANNKKLSISILILGILGYILSSGTSHGNIFASFNTFLYDSLPLYRGFREPHKWIIFLIIAYGYFGGYGVKRISDFIPWPFLKSPIMVSLLILPLLYTPSMLFGFTKQLTIRHFPQEWEEIRTYAQSDIVPTKSCNNKNIGGKCYTFLYVPWHEYIGFNWLGKIVYSGILNSITHGNLIGDNIEVGSIYSQSERKESKIIERYVGPGGTLRKYDPVGGDKELVSFKKEISDLGIQYIVLLKEADFKMYKTFLESMVTKGLLEVEKDNKMITLYKNTK